MATRTNSVFFLDFVDQWDSKSPWHDQRVRLAASLAIDRKAINEAESLGFSGLTGNIVPRHMEFALPIEAHPYDVKRAKQLLAEAGYANGFDAGDLTPNPPYFGLGEAVANYLGAVGIKIRVRSLERAASRLPAEASEMRPATDASDAVILHLWQAVQIVIDLAVSACLHWNLGAPASYADAFRRLSNAGIVEEPLAERLARAAGFRNVIAHAYDALDMTRVFGAARKGPADLEAFLAALRDRL